MEASNLIKEAIQARERAYAPYSNFLVGAALLTKEGKVYKGCNIESDVFSPSICAERVAMFKALSEGETEFSAIAIVGGFRNTEPSDPCFPCGVCRQVMSEHVFLDEFQVIVGTPENYKVYTLKQLLPEAFVLKDE